MSNRYLDRNSRNFAYDAYNNSLSCWQSGLSPGTGYNSRNNGGSSLQRPQPPSNISQLVRAAQFTSTAQLAIALNNLLHSSAMRQLPTSLFGYGYSNSQPQYHHAYQSAAAYQSNRHVAFPIKRQQAHFTDKKINRSIQKQNNIKSTNQRKNTMHLPSCLRSVKSKDVRDNKSNNNSEKKLNETENEESDPEDENTKYNMYDTIPTYHLRCVICQHTELDGESFQRHLHSSAHKKLRNTLDKTIQLKSDLMRQDIKIAEQRRVLEMQRKKRAGINVNMRKGFHCNMCNFVFIGRGAVHRRSKSHQKLKQFLHPTCKQCKLEFPSRIQWLNHRMTPKHLQARTVLEHTDIEEYKIIDYDDEDNKSPSDEELELNGDNINERSDCILEIDDNTDLLTDFNERVPKLNHKRSIGINMTMSNITGFQCKLCNLFFETKSIAQAHTKTITHYQNYIRSLLDKCETHTDQIHELCNGINNDTTDNNCEDDDNDEQKSSCFVDDDNVDDVIVNIMDKVSQLDININENNNMQSSENESIKTN